MRNIKLKIEYDGTNYCGWQVQNRHKSTKNQTLPRKSIQETIEKTLRKILREKIRLIASGRTDAGVHALAQVANFRTNSDIILKKLQPALNGLLPKDIVITDAEEVGLKFHSRFDAKSKIYRYTILNRKYPSVLGRNRVYFYTWPLDVKLMQKEASCLIGRHNFRSFQAADKKKTAAVRTIKKIVIKKNRGLIQMDIEADGFLYNMVRNIIGTLIEIGRGRFPEASMKRILLSKDRKLAGPTVPAKGLCLLEVRY